MVRKLSLLLAATALSGLALAETAGNAPISDDGTIGYGPAWYVDYGWSGEYPDGVTIQEEGVIIKGRMLPILSLPTDLTCPLPKDATIHQWNNDRVDAMNMRFISANLIGSYNVVQSGTIYADKMVNPTDEAGSLELSVGDAVQYLRYYGEGFGAIRYEGADYVVDLREVEALSETPTDEGMEHAWVRLDCDDEFQTEAWLFLGDLQAHEGVGPANITGFGEAPDATAD